MVTALIKQGCWLRLRITEPALNFRRLKRDIFSRWMLCRWGLKAKKLRFAKFF
jgi:hypothetical protein